MALFAIATSTATAQTLTFDNSADWWIAPKFRSMVSLTSEHNLGDGQLLKFDITDFGDNALASCPSKSSLNLAAGKHEVTVKVYLEKAPKGFNITFKNRGGGNFKSLYFPLKGVESGKWVEVTQTVQLDEISDGQMIILVNDTARGGVGTFYIKEVEIK